MSGVTVKTITVKLTGQAKVGDRWIPAGDQAVSAEERDALEAAGVLDLGRAPMLPQGATIEFIEGADWDAAVRAEAEKISRKAILDRDAAITTAVNAVHERDNLTELVASLRQANDDLTAQLNARADNPAPDAPGEKAPEKAEAEETPAHTDTPQSEKAPKTAPKKGAGATTKG